jgi:hypothetical protein
MKNYLFLFILLLFSLCLSAQDNWDNIVVTENTEIFIDSTNIKMENGKTYAYIKTVYTTEDSRQTYINKIKRVFPKNADKKIKKWEDFKYTITYGIYDCGNNRFKILEVEDFDSTGKKIIKTKMKEEKARWLNVDTDTVGDYTLFYICDYKE